MRGVAKGLAETRDTAGTLPGSVPRLALLLSRKEALSPDGAMHDNLG